MNLEEFAKKAIENKATGFTFSDLALDKNTGKVTAILQDAGDTVTAHVRIEGDKLVFQSYDEDGDAKPEAPHVSEAKQEAAEKAAASAKTKKA